MRCSRGHPRQQCHSDIILPPRDKVFIAHVSFAWAQPHRIEHKAEAMRQFRQQELQAGETIFRNQHASPVQVTYGNARMTLKRPAVTFSPWSAFRPAHPSVESKRLPVTDWETTVGRLRPRARRRAGSRSTRLPSGGRQQSHHAKAIVSWRRCVRQSAATRTCVTCQSSRLTIASRALSTLIGCQPE